MILIGKLFNWFNQIPNQFIEFYAYNQETAVIWCQKMVLKVKFLIFQIVLILTVICYIKKRSFTIWFLKPSLFLFWRFLIPSSTVCHMICLQVITNHFPMGYFFKKDPICSDTFVNQTFNIIPRVILCKIGNFCQI